MRLSFESGGILYEAVDLVPGRVLDPFSMDEYRGYFRIATTSWIQDPRKGRRPIRVNNLYIINSDLEIMGRLEGLGAQRGDILGSIHGGSLLPRHLQKDRSPLRPKPIEP